MNREIIQPGPAAPPTSEVTLVLAAHGSPVDSGVNRAVKAMANRIREREVWANVVAAFHYGDPGFADSLQKVNSRIAVVVPLMSSEGYFTERVTGQFLAAATQRRLCLTVSPPVGTHHRSAEIVAERIQQVLQRFDWELKRTDVLLVGHGTRRHKESRKATSELAGQLAPIWQSNGLVNVTKPIVGYIDDDPTIEKAVSNLLRNQLLVFPFLISNGPHAQVDVPEALGLGKKENAAEPWRVDVNGKQVVIDIPFGSLSAVEALIFDRANDALRSLELKSVTEGGQR